jgi:DNA-directed RNA polymerase subunit N (RpoN/RPB10)
MYELQMREMRKDVRESIDYQDYLELLCVYNLKIVQYKSKKASLVKMKPEEWNYLAERRTVAEENEKELKRTPLNVVYKQNMEKANKEIADYWENFNKSLKNMQKDIEEVVDKIMLTAYVKRFYTDSDNKENFDKFDDIKQSYNFIF